MKRKSKLYTRLFVEGWNGAKDFVDSGVSQSDLRLKSKDLRSGGEREIAYKEGFISFLDYREGATTHGVEFASTIQLIGGSR